MVIPWTNFDVCIQEEISVLLWLLAGEALRKSLRPHFLRTVQSGRLKMSEGMPIVHGGVRFITIFLLA